MFISTILGSTFGAGSYCLHRVRVYIRLFSIYHPVNMKYRLFRFIQTIAPNTGFFLSTVLVNNSLISTRFWNSMLDRYAIRNLRAAVLIMSMKRSPCFHNSSAAGTDAKYESTQTIMSVLADGITSFFSTFVPWGRFFLSSCCSSSFFAYFKILSRIIIPDRQNTEFWIFSPFSGFLYISTYIGKPQMIQWPPCLYYPNMDSSAHMRSERENRCVQYSLKLVAKSSMSFHQWASWIVPSSCTSGWCIHQTCLHSISKRWLFIPVLPK